MKRQIYRAIKGVLKRLHLLEPAYRLRIYLTPSPVVSIPAEREVFVSQCFDAKWYREKYLQSCEEMVNPWEHYIHRGWKLDLDPCDFFWSEWYLDQNPDVRAACINPLQHFEQYGATELRNPSPLFDTAWYARINNIDPNKQNPLAHYLSKGRQLGYAPRPDQVVDSFMRGANYGGHASVALDQIEWKLIHAGQDALLQGKLCTGRAYSLNRDIEITERSFLQEIGREMQQQRISCAVPPYSIVFDDVVILPGSTSLIKDGCIINDEIASLPINANLKLWDRTWRRNDDILVQYTVGLNPVIEIGIHLFKEYEQNYFHFVAEVLPKLIAYERLRLDVSIPLLVSDDLDCRLYELVNLIKNPERRIVKLKRNVPYLVNKLFYISDLSLVRDVYDRTPTPSDTYLPEELLSSIAEHALSRRELSINERRRRKLFITRSGKRRKIVNETEIVDSLIRRDFELINLDYLSITSQIELFSSADMIVGGTGAGFTNLLWCNPGTRAVILYPDHPYSNTTFWDRIGVARHLNIEYIYGERENIETGIYAMHDDFKIELEHLSSVV